MSPCKDGDKVEGMDDLTALLIEGNASDLPEIEMFKDSPEEPEDVKKDLEGRTKQQQLFGRVAFWSVKLGETQTRGASANKNIEVCRTRIKSFQSCQDQGRLPAKSEEKIKNKIKELKQNLRKNELMMDELEMRAATAHGRMIELLEENDELDKEKKVEKSDKEEKKPEKKKSDEGKSHEKKSDEKKESDEKKDEKKKSAETNKEAAGDPDGGGSGSSGSSSSSKSTTSSCNPSGKGSSAGG